MSAAEIVACANALQLFARHVSFWLGSELASSEPELDAIVYRNAKDAAHEARRLLRLTGELGDES